MSILSVFKKQEPAKKETSKKKEVKESAAKKTESALAVLEFGIIVRPVITEKSTLLNEQGKYVFEVKESASKQDVRRSIEKQFKVHVEKVNVVNLPSKIRMRGAIVGHVSGYKKAIVALRTGETIDLT